MSADQIWQALDPTNNEFRVVSILSSDEDKSPLSCLLSTVSLDENPVYEAFSYTWGDPSITHSISLNGSDWRISTNLHDALQQFRADCILGPIFIDALCIKQDDLDEKSSQVPLMGRIYRQASTVRCWLGCASQNTGRALQILEMIAEDALPTEIEVDEEPVSNADLESILDVLSRPYWTRVWILQEFLLPAHGVLHCGPFDINRKQLPSLDQLHAAVSSVLEDGRSLKMVASSTKQYKIYKARSDLLDKFLDDCLGGAFGGMSMHLYTHVSQSSTEMTEYQFAFLSSLQATWMHDRIYGFMALMNQAFAVQIVPDYRQSAGTVFKDFAFMWMRHFNTARLLELCIGLASNCLCIPTWTPDFSAIDRSLNKWEAMFLPNQFTDPAIVNLNEGVLSIQGFLLDYVEDNIRAEMEHPTRPNTFLDLPNGDDSRVEHKRAIRHHKRWRKFFGLPDMPVTSQDYVCGGTLEDAYWSTLIMDHYSDDSDGDNDDKKLSENMKTACKAWMKREVSNSKERLRADVRAQVQLYHSEVETSLDKRYLFRTAKGYIGLTDRSTELRKGDAIFFIATTAAPFILRPIMAEFVDDGPRVYQIVSCAYIHGAMLDRIAYENEDDIEATFKQWNAVVETHPQSKLANGQWGSVLIA